MLLKNGEIFNAKEPLQKLLAEKPPFAVSYGLAVLASKLDVQLGIIEKVRNGLVQTYGEKNPDNPQQIKVNPQSESFPKFVAEYNELMSKEVEIVLDVVEIPSTVELTVEPTVLLALLKFIKMVKK